MQALRFRINVTILIAPVMVAASFSAGELLVPTALAALAIYSG